MTSYVFACITKIINECYMLDLQIQVYGLIENKNYL